MSDQISASDNSNTAVADNQSTTFEPATSVPETGATNGQAQNGGAPDDIFKGIDPKRLPPEAKVHYDSMLKDYREKTARLSETIKTEAQKAAEAFKSKAELYDQIATQEEFVKQWNEYVQKTTQPQGNQPGDPKVAQLEAQLQEIKTNLQMNELLQVTTSFAEAQDEKGQLLHPDFDQLNSISIGKMMNGKQAEDFSLLRACIELSQGNPQEKLANGYKTAKAIRDSIFEEGKKAGMGRVQAKVLNSSNPPSNSSGDVLSVTDKRPKNAHEAFEMAKRGMIVSRD